MDAFFPDDALQITLMGPICIRRAGIEIGLPASRKTRAILGLLLLADRPLSRQRLCDLFFDIPDDPRAALRWSLSKLRPILATGGAPGVITKGDTVSVDRSRMVIDVWLLRQLADDNLAAQSETALRQALGWAPWAFLEDCELPDQPEFAAWLTAHRHEMIEKTVRVLHELASRFPDDPASRIAPLQRLIAADPLNERAYSGLVAALNELGRSGDAAQIVEQAERALLREGISPGVALRSALKPRAEVRRSEPRAAADDPQANAIASIPGQQNGLPVIAILPLVDLSLEAMPGHVAEGFFEGMVHALSRFRSLTVIAAPSTASIRGQLEDPVQTGRRLGADILVGGSLMRAADGRLRLRWRAVDGAQGQFLAFGDVKGHLDDVWDFQERAASVVAVEVEPRAQGEAYRMRTVRPTGSAAAYDLYLQGLFAGFSVQGRDYAKALDLFEQAIALDPEFHPALAIAPWAAAYANRIAGPADLHRFSEMSRAALRLGIADARTQATAGTALFYMAHDYAAARSAIGRAIEINPNEYTAWICGGWMHAMKGEADDAHRMFDRAERLNPLAYAANGLIAGRAMAEFMAGRVDEAERHIRLALATDDGHPSVLMTGVATAARLDLPRELDERRRAFLKIYPDGLSNISIQALPFEDQNCRERYFSAVRDGIPG